YLIDEANLGDVVISGRVVLLHPKQSDEREGKIQWIRVQCEGLWFEPSAELVVQSNFRLLAKEASGSIRIVGDRPHRNGQLGVPGGSGTVGLVGADGEPGANGRAANTFKARKATPGETGGTGERGGNGTSGASGSAGRNGLSNVAVQFHANSFGPN